MEKKSGFYGGKIGVWLPVLFMLVGMLVSTIIGGGGLARLTGITFFALALGFLLAKDKKNYGKITLKGLQNPMLGTIIMAYIMGGALATTFLIIIPVLVIGLLLIARKAMPAFRAVFRKYDKLNESVEENVRAMRVVKGFDREGYEKQKFAADSHDIANDFTFA